MVDAVSIGCAQPILGIDIATFLFQLPTSNLSSTVDSCLVVDAVSIGCAQPILSIDIATFLFQLPTSNLSGTGGHTRLGVDSGSAGICYVSHNSKNYQQ